MHDVLDTYCSFFRICGSFLRFGLFFRRQQIIYMHILYLREWHKIFLRSRHVIFANLERHLRQHVVHEYHFGEIIPARPRANDIASPSNGGGELIILRFYKINLRNGSF